MRAPACCCGRPWELAVRAHDAKALHLPCLGDPWLSAHRCVLLWAPMGRYVECTLYFRA